MSSSTANCPLGHCLLTYNSTSLGLTRGGCELEIEIHLVERCQDEYGPTATDLYFAGASARLHTCIAEHTLELLSRVMPGSSIVGGSVLHLGGSVGSKVVGYPLVLTPVDERDPIGEITIQKAVPLPEGRITYYPGKERLVPIVFQGVLDSSIEDGGRLAKWRSSSDQTPPSIIGSDPQQGDTGVDRETSIDIVFSEKIGPLTNQNFILLDETNDEVLGCALDSSAVSEDEFHVMMTPNETLAASAVHRVIIAGIADNSGNQTDVQIIQFTTGS